MCVLHVLILSDSTKHVKTIYGLQFAPVVTGGDFDGELNV